MTPPVLINKPHTSVDAKALMAKKPVISPNMQLPSNRKKTILASASG